jgi:O-antigen/teichoic acid export membrane protein
MSTVFIVMGVTLGPKWFNVKPDDILLLRWAFAAGGVGLFLNYYSQFWNSLSQAHLDFKFLSIVSTTISLMQILPAIFWAWLTHNPLIIIIWGVFVSLLQLSIFVWHSRSHYGLGFNLRAASLQRLREMGSFTGKIFGTQLLNSVFGSIDRLLLGRLAPRADYAHYMISVNAGMRMVALTQSAMGPVFHNTSRAVSGGGKMSAAEIYNTTFRFIFGWCLLASVWVIVWHPLLLRLWLGADLGSQVAPVFTPIFVALVICAIANISTSQLAPLNRAGTTLIFTAISIPVNIGCVLTGWHLYGIRGAAYGVLFARVVELARDIYFIRLVKAGGWLAPATWLHILVQGAIGLGFYLLARWMNGPLTTLLFLAALHFTGVALWLVRSNMKSESQFK